LTFANLTVEIVEDIYGTVWPILGLQVFEHDVFGTIVGEFGRHGGGRGITRGNRTQKILLSFKM
jgi:hypothetical protein